jgi:hypothetical protein
MRPRTLTLCVRVQRRRSTNTSTTATMWGRIALRWRRRRPRLTSGIKPVTMPRVSRHFALHLHHHIDAGTRVAITASPAPLQSMSESRSRAMRFDSIIPQARAAHVVELMRRVDRARTPPAAHGASAPHRRSDRLTRVTQYTRMSVGTSMRSARSARAPGRLPTRHGMERRTTETTAHRRSELRTRTTAFTERYRRIPVASLGSEGAGNRVPLVAGAPALQPVTPEAVSVARSLAEPVSLVWRTRGRGVAAADDTPMRKTVPAADAAAMPTSAPVRGEVPAAATVEQRAEPSRRLIIDAALAERLAEDVMRRVEKRIRIERERRGL